MKINSVCVYCASSSKLDQKYYDAAKLLGRELAKNEVKLVYGGGNRGLMGVLADEVLKHGGHVTGVIPQFMHEEGWSHDSLSELSLVGTMHERKFKMSASVDAAIALPGGCGTLEELLEVITWKQLGLFTRPIIIVNTDGYYDPLLQLFNNAIAENFMGDQHLQMWTVVALPEEVLPAIENSMKWMDNPRSIAAI